MEKSTKILLWIVLGILVLLVIIQTLQLSVLGKVIASGGKAAGVTQPAQPVAPTGGMVGGC